MPPLPAPGAVQDPASEAASAPRPPSGHDALLILVTTVFTISALYAPQPLLEILRMQFNVERTTAALLVTAVMLPLGILPAAYGLLLQKWSPKSLLIPMTFLLALTEAGIALAPSYPVILGVRIAQGLMIPAVLTALMTHLSAATPPASLQRTMALYIAATIFGGFFGRFSSGILGVEMGWRTVFMLLCAAHALNGLWLFKLPSVPPVKGTPATLGTMTRCFRTTGFLPAYGVIFCCFFVFSALLNFIPFRLAEISGTGTGLSAAFVYTGYLMGLVVSVGQSRCSKIFGGQSNTVIAGILVLASSTALFAVPAGWAIFAAMFPLCAGLFLSHSTAPGLVNTAAGNLKGTANGLYVSFYYLGGSLGTFLPGPVYQAFGWNTYLVFLLGVAAAGLACGIKLKRGGITAIPPEPLIF